MRSSIAAVRVGRRTSSPPQFGHRPLRMPSAHVMQNVHSNEQMTASVASGGKSLLQHSQFGRSCSDTSLSIVLKSLIDAAQGHL